MKHTLIAGLLGHVLVSGVSHAQNPVIKPAPTRTIISGTDAFQNLAERVAPPKPFVFSLAPEDIQTPRNLDLLLAHVEKAVVEPGDRVTLKTSIKNTTDKTLTFHENYPLYEYKIRVYNITQEAGRTDISTLTPLTEYGKAMLLSYPRILHRSFTSYLKQGETKEASFVVNRLFDMTRAGKYSVVVSRHANEFAYIRTDVDINKDRMLLVSAPVLVEVRP